MGQLCALRQPAALMSVMRMFFLNQDVRGLIVIVIVQPAQGE